MNLQLVYSLLRVLVILITLPSIAYSVGPVILNDSTDDLDLNGKYYQLFEDPTAKLSIADISSEAYINKFYTSKEDYNQVEDSTVAYWIKFSIDDHSTHKRKWVVELLSNHTDEIQFYVPNNDGSFHLTKTGTKIPFIERAYRVSNLVFDLPADLNGQTFYARIHSRHLVGFEFKVRSNNYFTSYAVNEYYILGIYYGILLIMAVYNVLLFITSRERTYIYYVLYVISCMIFSFTEDGYGFQFIWSNFPSLNFPVNSFGGNLLLLISFILYSTSFLELRKRHPKFYKMLLISTGVYCLLFLLEPWLPKFIPIYDLYSLPFATIYVMAILVYRNGYKAARFFILGFSFVFLSVVMVQLRDHNFVEDNIFTVYFFNYGILLEVIVLSFALGDRIKMMKEDKDKAQRVLIQQLEHNQVLQEKVNKELEIKVSERTKELMVKTNELTEANTKLTKLTEELNKFASRLDIDNWELNKKIVEETKARMLSKELSLEEFGKIFPNEFFCLKYLEELKWGSSFKCKKCSNLKFAVKPKLLSRKCSKCNYIESVTSSTIFHGIKFPLNKAFYLAYITSVKSDTMTVDELADLLQLNRITCWKFRKKVLEREDEIKKKSNLTKLDNWEILLKEY